MNDEAEKLLVFIVDKARKSRVSTIAFNVDEVMDIYDISSDLNELLDQLELSGMLSNYIIAAGGNVEAYLTPTAMKYLIGARRPRPDRKKPRADSRTKAEGQQKPDKGVGKGEVSKRIAELEEVTAKIEKSLPALESLDAGIVADILELIQEEMAKLEPRGCRLMNCLTLLSSAMSNAAGVPALKKDLELLGNIIAKYIK